jgi:hypothetical protein
LVAFVYLFCLFIVVAPIISIKNDGIVASVMKLYEGFYLYWSGYLMLELGIHAEEYKIKLLDDKLK